MNIVVVDDCMVDRQILLDWIMEYTSKNSLSVVTYLYKNGKEFFDKIILSEIDLLFLDIYMDGLNGMDIAKSVRDKGYDFPIIFTTASESHGVQSYKVRAFDYIVKPIGYEQIEKSMDLLLENQRKKDKFIVIKVAREFKKVILSRINYVDCHNHYVQIHTDKEVIKVYQKFGEFEENLICHGNFLTCFRCVMVNMDKVEKIASGWFVLSSGDHVPINKKKANDINAAYRNYVFGEIGNRHD